MQDLVVKILAITALIMWVALLLMPFFPRKLAEGEQLLDPYDQPPHRFLVYSMITCFGVIALTMTAALAVGVFHLVTR